MMIIMYLQIQDLLASSLWLAASHDRRVSIWSSDWSKDLCELIDWLTFPAPGFAPDGTILHKSERVICIHFQLQRLFT